MGNHDQVCFSEYGLQSLFGVDDLYYSINVEGVHFIFLFSRITVPPHSHAIIPEEQLDWLTDDLEKTELPAIVFMHHSLADQDLGGNFWFAESPEECLVDNRRRVRSVLAESGKVLAIVNGHLHWNRVDMHDGLPYISVQSLVENVNNDGTPAGAYTLLEVDRNTMVLKVFGADRFRYAHTRETMDG